MVAVTEETLHESAGGDLSSINARVDKLLQRIMEQDRLIMTQMEENGKVKSELQKLQFEVKRQDLEIKHLKEKVGLEKELSEIKHEQIRMSDMVRDRSLNGSFVGSAYGGSPFK